jgi:hypothetical protein
VGQGAVAYIPADVFNDFNHNRYPLTRLFIENVVESLDAYLDIEVQAPVAIDVALRRKGDSRIIHLINRGSGIPNTPGNGAIDEIPRVGPITIKVDTEMAPAEVTAAFEPLALKWRVEKGKLVIHIPSVHIHAAVVIR